MKMLVCKYATFVLSCYFLLAACSPASSLRHNGTDVTVEKDHRIKIRHNGVETFYNPQFLVLYSAVNPEPAMRPAGIKDVLYNAVTWLSAEADAQSVTRTADQTGDGFDDRILDASVSKRSFGLFNAGENIRVCPAGHIVDGDKIHFNYPEQDKFTLQATLTIDEENNYPVLTFTVHPKVKGFFSVGYDGYRHYAVNQLHEIWQPMIWQDKRVPDREYMTLAFRCPVPSAFIATDRVVEGVVACPSEFPFDPLPTAENSRFGVAVRTADTLLTPMLFAPVLGGVDSEMDTGDAYSFRAILFVSSGNTTDALEKTAVEIYGFRDYRSNATGTLNNTIENIIGYAMSSHSWFIDEQKGCAYSTDVPDAVKNVSCLNPLEIALINDNEQMYDKRAYPILEYMLSREKFLFSADSMQKIQYPSRKLNGPCAPLSELTSLYNILDRKDPFLVTLAENEYKHTRVRNLDVEEAGENWKNAMSLYKATGEKAWLERACTGADSYMQSRIDKRPVDFTDPDAGGFFFWTGFAPKWIDLLELYELTGTKKYLDAAHKGARQYTQYIWFCPAIPDSVITVNPEGKAPHYAYLKQKGHIQMDAPAESVEAWRLSEIGLTPESSGTCTGHRGIFMANYAAWMVRMAYYTGDDFLAQVAKSAIVGRYASFPGYHINTARTTVYEKKDYPLHSHKELSVNSFHYNHIMPHISLLYDYLISDMLYRSNGKISFPDEFIEAYAYLQSKFYGHKPGKFYGEEAWLWMPSGLVNGSDQQLNYISARGNNKLFIAFTNQSREEVTSEILLDTARLHFDMGREYEVKVRINNGEPAGIIMKDGRFTINVPASGLVAVSIEGVMAKPAFQQKILAPVQDVWQKDYTQTSDGNVQVMLLNVGQETRNVYVWFKAEDTRYSSVTVSCGDLILTDAVYPYELTFPLPTGAEQIEISARAQEKNGKLKQWESVILKK